MPTVSTTTGPTRNPRFCRRLLSAADSAPRGSGRDQACCAMITPPTWAPNVFFDLKAKTESSSSEEELRLMLRALLAERFSLKTHWQTRELSYYALVEERNGPKLK